MKVCQISCKTFQKKMLKNLYVFTGKVFCTKLIKGIE